MARGVNKVILVGNLGADPETRSMPSGMTVTNIRIATSESWKDKASGAQQERTEWHSIALFGRLGEIAAEYLRKGSQVFVEGKLRTRKWQDKQGNDRFTTEIIADNMQMLGGRGGGGPGAGEAARALGGAAPQVARAAERRRAMTMTNRRRRPAAKRNLTTTFRSDLGGLIWARERCGYRLIRVAAKPRSAPGSRRFAARWTPPDAIAPHCSPRPAWTSSRSTCPPPAAR